MDGSALRSLSRRLCPAVVLRRWCEAARRSDVMAWAVPRSLQAVSENVLASCCGWPVQGREAMLVVEGLFLESSAGGLAEGLEGGKRNEVRTANTKSLKLRAAYSALYPLVYGLPRDRRLDALSCLLNTEVVTCLSVGADPASFAPFATGTAHSEVCKSVTEVHECQAYHTFIARAMPRIHSSRMAAAEVAGFASRRGAPRRREKTRVASGSSR